MDIGFESVSFGSCVVLATFVRRFKGQKIRYFRLTGTFNWKSKGLDGEEAEKSKLVLHCI